MPGQDAQRPPGCLRCRAGGDPQAAVINGHGWGHPGGLLELIETSVLYPHSWPGWLERAGAGPWGAWHFIKPRLGEMMTEAWQWRPCCQRWPDGGQTCAHSLLQ
ncbi:unnamed protein product [Gadus morhua 'NCC']